jgi:hypothetical protein
MMSRVGSSRVESVGGWLGWGWGGRWEAWVREGMQMGGREEVKIGTGSVVDVVGEMRGEIGGVVWSVGRGLVWSGPVTTR